MPLITFAIPDLTCGNCARHIRAALSAVAGLGACTIDIPAQRVQVEAASPQAIAAAQARLADEGYPATIVS